MSSPEEALKRIGATVDRLKKKTKKAKASIKRIEDLNRKEKKIPKRVLN
jgi:hypothetical protein